jgi:hypothetical protein
MPRPAPATLLLLAAAAALAAAAPAAGASMVLETIAREYKAAMPACAGLLFPPSAELAAAGDACWRPIRDDADAPPAACPSPECGAYAAAMGRACWEEFSAADSEGFAAAAAALSGGKAISTAAVAKFQVVQDASGAAVTATGGHYVLVERGTGAGARALQFENLETTAPETEPRRRHCIQYSGTSRAAPLIESQPRAAAVL